MQENYDSHVGFSLQNHKGGGSHINYKSPESQRFCNDEVPHPYYDGIIQNYTSNNQKLVGPANPKTLIPPVVVPHSHDLSYWKANNLVTHSAINEESQCDLYQSGYKSFNECECRKSPCECRVEYCGRPERCTTFRDKVLEYPHGHGVRLMEGKYGEVKKNSKKNSKKSSNLVLPYDKSESKSTLVLPHEIKEEFVLHEGSVNTNCGYRPEQIHTSGLPTNYPSSTCERHPKFKEHHTNLFTNIIQPGVYTTNEVNEPINSNIGISHQQQFRPLTQTVDNRGNIMFRENDANVIEPFQSSREELATANTFDPRHSGYGTSYRAYNDSNLGQPRFFYDDVNSIRMPNYITRSNIDFLPCADSYGSVDGCGNKDHKNIRNIANDGFLESALQHRTELQERLMRKHNARAWQQKMYPIHTGGQSMLGGMHKM